MLSVKKEDGFKFVSFDVFDTLVARMVAKPSDVFEIMQRKLAKTTSEVSAYASNFASMRIEAERSARAKACTEVTLNDIYEELSIMRGSDLRTIQELMDLEVQVELDVCVARPDGQTIYKEVRSQGLPIVITSDMYLPCSIITTILERCGYEGWTRCFVSNDYGATKRDGRLFDVVVSSLGVNPSEIIHIGDNLRSDFVMARRKGLCAKRIKGSCQAAYGSLEESVLASARRIATEAAKDPREVDVELIGYRDFGPVLAGFCDWLNAQLLEEGIEKVFYLARDGLIVQKAMKLLGYHSFEGEYLYASRRALQVPSYATIDSLKELIESMYLPEQTTLLHILKKTGIASGSIGLALHRAGLEPDGIIRVAEIEKDERILRAFSYLKEEIRENARRERSLLVSYLKQIGFSGKVAIVDIGWFGNMQLALEKVCRAAGIDAEIHGYYVGLNPDGRHQFSHAMKGFLFDSTHGREQFDRERRYNTIFEIFFSAFHGTTRGFERANGTIQPVLAAYEGVERATGEKAEVARRGALRFVKDWAKLAPEPRGPISVKTIMCGMDRLGISPTFQEACLFGDWTMEDDGNIVHVAKPGRAFEYIRRPSRFLHDLGPAHWKIGFLKRVFRVPFPYGKVLIAAMKPLELIGVVRGPSSCRSERKVLWGLLSR